MALSARKKWGMSAAAGALALMAGGAAYHHMTAKTPPDLPWPNSNDPILCDRFARQAVEEPSLRESHTGRALKRMLAEGKVSSDDALVLKGIALGDSQTEPNRAVAYGIIKTGCTL